MSTPPNNERIIINGASFNAGMFHEILKKEADKFLNNYKFREKVKKKRKRIKKLIPTKYSYSKRRR